MTSFPLRFLALAGAALALAGPALASEPPIIAKARAYLGSEAALSAIKSVRFTGTLVAVDPADPAKQTRAAMEIIFQKPEQQRIMATSDKTIEVTSLDGYEGWQRVQDAADPSKWRQTLLGTEQIKRLRAQTWENLAFFRGIEQVGGRAEDQGPVTFEGVPCRKIAFIHAPNIIFYRYFDVATGRLVATETENGSISREEGEMRVEGVRFPKVLTMTSKTAAGQMQTVTINFETITLNETFPATIFAVPALSRR